MGLAHRVSVPWENELKFKLNRRGQSKKCSQLALWFCDAGWRKRV